MTRQLVNVGTVANDGTGELGPRGWLQKFNNNSTDLYNAPNWGSTVNAGAPDFTGTAEVRITAAVALALVGGKKYVWIPQLAWDGLAMLPYNANLATLNSNVHMIREGGPTSLGIFDVHAYGATGGDGPTDTAALVAICAQLPHSTIVEFQPAKNYTITSTLQINVKGITFRNNGQDQSGINYTGTGSLIQLGTDNGLQPDLGLYDGIASGFELVGLSLAYTGSGTTPLLNGFGNYGTGTYAIRDWRGGSIRFNRCSFQNWDYAFWGVQSDINFFSDFIMHHCHSGIYMGPRSDQSRFDHFWTFSNDQVLFFEAANGAYITQWITDGDGSATTNPCKIKNGVYTGTRPCEGIIFMAPWLEDFDGSTAFSVEAFIEVGVGDLVMNGGVSIINPTIAVNLYSTGGVPHTLHMIKADKVAGITILDPNGVVTVPWNNLRSLLKIVNAGASTTVPAIFFQDSTVTTSRFSENYSATSVVCHMNIDGNATYTNNVVGGTGNVIMGQLGLHRKLIGNNAAVGATTGDITLNRSWNGTGLPWAWVHNGSTNVPFIPDGMSSDRGDVSVTLAVGTDYPTQQFASTLTAARTVTVNVAGAARGSQFRIVRTGGGAFNLTVQDSVPNTLKVLTVTGQWVDVQFDGAAWKEVAFGAL